MPDRIGQQLGNYQLLRLLGEGGFAEVYLGEHIHLGTQAAIKVLHTQLTSNDVDKFRTEARTIARLIHPHIVRILEFGIEGKTPYLIMDYASNGTLRQRHPKGVSLPLSLVVAYVKQIADALQYAHDEKVIHRDVKPENMLLGRRNEILLSDFGIALVAQSSRYQSDQEIAGTMAYMAPEQIQGKPRAASDQYSLGIVVYEWLTGDRPFHGSLTELVGQHLAVPPPSLREKIPTISPEVDQIVLTALAKDPKQRFDNIQTFADTLHEAAQPSQSMETLGFTIKAPMPPMSPEPVSLLSSDQKPEGVLSSLVETESAHLEPITQTADGVASSQISTPALHSSPQKRHRTFAQSKRWRITFVLIPLILILVAGGSLGFWRWRTVETAQAYENATATAQTNSHATATAQTNSYATATAQANSRATATALAKIPGRIWHVQNSGTSNTLYGVAWSGSLFVAVGTSGTILTSPDERTWTAQNSGTSNTLYGVVWSGSLFVVVGERTILASPDGHTWTAQNSGSIPYDLYGVTWSSSLFVAVGRFYYAILTSSDGYTWTAQNSGTSNSPGGVAWSGSLFAAAVGDSGTIPTSPNKHTGTNQSSASSGLWGVVWSGSLFVAVGSFGTIVTSPDGYTWTAQTSGASGYLWGVVWSGSLFVVVGGGTILTSPDGHTWTAQNSGTSNNLGGVAWSGSQFIAVGTGTILTSPDGHTWTAQTSGTSNNLDGVVWSGSQFIAVGTSGTILTSP